MDRKKIVTAAILLMTAGLLGCSARETAPAEIIADPAQLEELLVPVQQTRPPEMLPKARGQRALLPRRMQF